MKHTEVAGNADQTGSRKENFLCRSLLVLLGCFTSDVEENLSSKMLKTGINFPTSKEWKEQ